MEFKMGKIKGGYYLKARCIQNSWIATAPPYVREIWDWLLKEANHSDGKSGNHIIKRGQLFRSYQDIRDGLKWTIGYRTCRYNENQTKKAMKALRKELMITTMKELGGVLITICNYDFYQHPKNYDRTNERTNESTTREPIKNHPLPDNNNKNKNDNNNYFAQFWELYPLKKGKEKAREKWNTKVISDEMALLVIEAVKKQLHAEMFDLREKKKYCPHPATWLHQGRWEDEIITHEKTIEDKHDSEPVNKPDTVIL